MKKIIIAVEELIRQKGIDNIEISEIAKKSGYSISKILNYFGNEEYLIAFGCIYYINFYVEDIVKYIDGGTSLDRYKKNYEIFNEYAFKYPEIFYKLYYTDINKKLDYIIKICFELFPEYYEEKTSVFKNCLINQANIKIREYEMLLNLAKDYIKIENIDKISEILRRIHLSYLLQAENSDDLYDVDKMNNEFLKCFDFIFENI